MSQHQETPTRSVAPDDSGAKAYYVLALLVIVYVFNFVDRQLMSVLLETVKGDLHIEQDWIMGLLVGPAFAIFYTFAGIPIARLADVRARSAIIAVAVAVWSLMTALTGAAKNVGWLMLTRVGVGVGEAGATPPSHSLISDYFPPEKRALALGVYTTGAYLGVLVAYPLGTWLNKAYGWRVAFYALGLPGLLLALVVWLTVREPERGRFDPAGQRVEAHTLGEVLSYIWSQRSLVHTMTAATLYAFVGYGILTWAAPFLIRVHGATASDLAWLGPIIGGGGALGSVAGGYLTDKLGKRNARWNMRLPLIGGLGMTPFMLLFLLWPDRGAHYWFFPAQLIGSLYLAPTFAMTQGLVKVKMRAMSAAVLLFTVNLVGLGLGPFMVGALNDLLAPSLGPVAIRYSLLAIVGTTFWAAIHSVLAMRTIEQDLARVATR